MPIQREKQQRLKEEFNRLDENGDGCLSLQELKAMLKKGNPNMTERQIAGLYHKIDKDGDGNVQFNEFVDYLFSGHSQNRTSAGRQERIAAKSMPQDSAEIPWGPVLERVTTDFGFTNGLESRDFAKIMTDGGLIDRKMNKNDADLIFTKCKARNARKITMDQFQDAVRLVAQKRNVTAQVVQEAIMNAELHMNATVADNVRFHDDKSTYTGAHAQNDSHISSAPGSPGSRGAGSPARGDRHSRIAATQAQVAAAGDDEDASMWDGAREKWTVFAGRNGQMENAEFYKMCQDAHLIGHGLNRSEVDVMFTRYARNRKLDFDGFKQCLRTVASKRNEVLSAVLEKIEQCGGPELHGTQADNVRFHDDESTYTGSHVRSAGSPARGDRHGRVAAAQAQVAAAGDDEDPSMWNGAREKFMVFAGRNGQMENAEFYKMCQDSRLIGKGLTRSEVDVMFTRFARNRKLEFEGFKQCVRTVASKRNEVLSAVLEKIEQCEGPALHATQAENVRFHDDESQYTGQHRSSRGLDDEANSMDARRQRVARRAAEDSPEDDWDKLHEVFDEYCTRNGEMDGKSFGDLCKFSGLLSRGFDRNQVDLIFAKVKPRGQRTIVFDEFQAAVRFIAPDKGMTVRDVQRAMVNNRREVNATQAAYNRFHDDEDMYTGVHHGKHH